MERIKNVLFDLDGTLTDPAEGITNALMHAQRRMGRPVSPREDLFVFIGPPLIETFMSEWGLSREESEQALVYYREHFGTKGLFENVPYEGIGETLADLKASGLRLFVATSKPEGIAREVLTTFGLTGYLEYIAGASSDRSRETKADVIRHLLEETGHPKGLVMVGDTIWDVLGAKELGIPCVGVSWGYGEDQDMLDAGAETVVATPKDLTEYLTGND